MEIVYYTVVAIGLYFMSDWILDRIETVRGKRLKNREIVFFAIILALAMITFQFIGYLSQPPK